MKKILTISGALLFSAVLSFGSSVVKQVKGSSLADVGSAYEVLRRLSILSEYNGFFYIAGQDEAVIYVDDKMIDKHTELSMISAKNIDKVEIFGEPRLEYGGRSNIVLITTINPQTDQFTLEDVAKLTSSPRPGGSNFLSVSGKKNKFHYEAGAMVSYKEPSERDIRFDDSYALLPGSANWYLDKRQIKSFNNTEGKLDVVANAKLEFDINPRHRLSLRYEFDYTRKRGTLENLRYDIFQRKNGVIDLRSPSESYRSDSFSDFDEGVHQLTVNYSGRVGQWNILVNYDLYGNHRKAFDLDNTFSREISGCTKKKNSSYTGSDGFLRTEASRPLWKGDVRFGLSLDDYLLSSESNDSVVEGSKIHVKTYCLVPSAFVALMQNFGPVKIDAAIAYTYAIYDYRPFEDDYTARAIEEKTGSSNIFNARNYFQPQLTISADLSDVQLSAGIFSNSALPSFTDFSVKTDRIVGKDESGALPRVEEQHSVFLKGAWKWIDFKGWATRYTLPIFKHSGGGYDYNGPDFWSMDYRLTLSPSLGFYQPSLTATLHRQWLTLDVVDPVDDLSTPLGTFQWNNGFDMPWGMRLDLNAFLRTTGADRNTYFRKTAWKVDASLQQKFLKNHLTVALEADNLFGKYCDEIAFYKDSKVGVLQFKEKYFCTLLVLSLRYTL